MIHRLELDFDMPAFDDCLRRAKTGHAMDGHLFLVDAERSDKTPKGTSLTAHRTAPRERVRGGRFDVTERQMGEGKKSPSA